MNDLTTTNNQGFLVVNTLADAMKVADIICKSSFCPKAFVGKPGDVLVCMQFGQELNLKPLQALQNIAVINGKPSIWGDAMLAICQASPQYEYVEETLDTATMTAYCKAKRKGDAEKVGKFSIEDAKKASLWGKQGPWNQYPERMLQMRARGFALRDAFADVLKGLISAEEAGDYNKQDHPKKDYVKTANIVVESTATVVPPPADEDMPSFMQDKPVALLTPDEVTLLADKMKQAGSDVGAVCKHMKIASIHFIPRAKLPEILAKLDEKIEKKMETKVEMNPEVAEFFEDEK